MSSAYFMLALREFAATPRAEAELLDGIGIAAADVGAEITLGQQLQQVRNINKRERAGWGLRLGNRFDAAVHGPLGFAAVSASTLAEAVVVIVRFAHVRSPYFRFKMRRDRDRVALQVDESMPLADEERIPVIECLMLAVQKLVESVLGGPMHEASFDFSWPTPRYAKEYRNYYHGTVHFGAPPTGIAFPARWLRLKGPMADPVVYRESMRKLEALGRRIDGDEHVVARVEQQIAASGASVPSLQQVARCLHVSSRTLIRRLRRAGTTYYELVDSHRRECAEELLKIADFGVAEVSHRVGYQDPTNFGRACRRWFGMSPGRYRKKLIGS